VLLEQRRERDPVPIVAAAHRDACHRQREERGEDQLMRQDQRKCQRSHDWKQGDALSPMHISRAAVVDASDASPRDVLASTTNSSSGSGGIMPVKQGRVNTILNRAIAIEFTILSCMD
jgi:hypothetical protein